MRKLPKYALEAKKEKRLISPSGMKVWLGCQRRWAYKYIDELPEPGSSSTELGKLTHTILESYLMGGGITDPKGAAPQAKRALKTAMAMIPDLPNPKKRKQLDFRIEQHWKFELEGQRKTDPDVMYHGFIDLVWRPERQIRAVRDHKSTGNLAYALTQSELLEDPQCNIYSYAMLDDTDVEIVRAEWGYGQTTKPYPTQLVTVDQTAEEVYVRMHELHERVGLPIVRAWREPVEARPQSLDYCGAFNRDCPFLARCKPKRPIGEIIMASAVERLKARKAAKAAKEAAAGGEESPIQKDELPDVSDVGEKEEPEAETKEEPKVDVAETKPSGSAKSKKTAKKSSKAAPKKADEARGEIHVSPEGTALSDVLAAVHELPVHVAASILSCARSIVIDG